MDGNRNRILSSLYYEPTYKEKKASAISIYERFDEVEETTMLFYRYLLPKIMRNTIYDII